MAKTLKIRFEGDTPGISDGRLSLSAFRNALAKLLAAFRSVADQTERGSENLEEAPNVGRFSKAAEQLDLQISSIAGNCVTMEFLPQTLEKQTVLFGDENLDRTLDRLIENIEAEAAGKSRNPRVRKLLAALPSGICKQEWSLWSNGTQEKRVTLGDIRLSSKEESIKYGTTLLTGRVAGVDFLPHPNVKLISNSRPVTLVADDELLRFAITCQHEEVVAKVVTTGGKPKRLLWLRRIDAADSVDRDQLAEELKEEWRETFRLLSVS
jgi:hypothetical protein